MMFRMAPAIIAAAALVVIGGAAASRSGAAAASRMPPSDASVSFIVDIIGNVGFADVAIIHRGLEYADGVDEVKMVRSERNYAQLSGSMSGDAALLIEDVRGLAQDRFGLETLYDPAGRLVITLRKLGAISP